jgi:8-oxo-dGTP diphosphatase
MTSFCYNQAMINTKNVHGAIIHKDSGRIDSLIRVSLKAVIIDEQGRVLVVKENGRDWWDIPGGGLDHGETIKEALARELLEEVLFKGDFEYEVLIAEDPRYLENHNLYQMRITFLVKPNVFDFGVGDDGDEIQFVDADIYEKSDLWTQRQIFKFSVLAKTKLGV